MRHPLQSLWQQKVFEDVVKERLYQDRQCTVKPKDLNQRPRHKEEERST
jgi:hypothetical protein